MKYSLRFRPNGLVGPRSRRASAPFGLLLNLLLVSLLLLGYTPARAQFPINESFTGTAAPAFSTGGNAALTRGANDTVTCALPRPLATRRGMLF